MSTGTSFKAKLLCDCEALIKQKQHAGERQGLCSRPRPPSRAARQPHAAAQASGRASGTLLTPTPSIPRRSTAACRCPSQRTSVRDSAHAHALESVLG